MKMNWKKAREIICSDSLVEQELEKIESEYNVIREVIRVRAEKSLTQKELADLVHSKVL